MLAWRNSDYSLTSKLPSSSAGRSKSRCLASPKASFCAEPSKYATSIMSRSQAVTAQGFPIAWIRARLMRAKTTREAVTATTTRKPAAATTFTSTPSPSAAIETVVKAVAAIAMGFSNAFGINPIERSAATSRKPVMNRGTSSKRLWLRRSSCELPFFERSQPQ